MIKNLWEDQFDGSLEGFSDCDHNISSKHPEYIVEEETAQENTAGSNVVQVEELHAVHCKRQAEKIVCEPVFFQDIPDTNTRAEGNTNLNSSQLKGVWGEMNEGI